MVPYFYTACPFEFVSKSQSVDDVVDVKLFVPTLPKTAFYLISKLP
jgi:hypothetical protein